MFYYRVILESPNVFFKPINVKLIVFDQETHWMDEVRSSQKTGNTRIH